MPTSLSATDYTLLNLAAGFIIGLGVVTVWTAIKQTRANRSPRRSIYIYMVWGEILTNAVMAIVGWLFVNGIIPSSLGLLIFLITLWSIEIQLLMQIIINRIGIIADDQRKVAVIKWGTAAFVTCINISVYVIWIPAHLASEQDTLFPKINFYWDRIEKALLLVLDCGLNYYFLYIVQHRLVKHHGLRKYKPLVSFNARLMVVSILMDVMLIGLLSLPNQLIYTQFQPAAYIVKLAIEMSMASLITKLARGSGINVNDMETTSQNHTNSRSHNPPSHIPTHHGHSHALQTFASAHAHPTGQQGESRIEWGDGKGIRKDTVFQVEVEAMSLDESGQHTEATNSESNLPMDRVMRTFDGDEVPLKDKRSDSSS